MSVEESRKRGMTDAQARPLRTSGQRADAVSSARYRPVLPRGEMPEVRCAFCGSDATEPMSIYGCHMMTAQYYCRSCRSTFDWVRDEWRGEA